MRLFSLIFIILFSYHAHSSSLPLFNFYSPFHGSRFIVPLTENPRTSIIILHGSEGGSEHFLDSEAISLAQKGYSVLLYCYFDCNRGSGLRQTLKNVEVSNILKAVEWLKFQYQSNKKVIVYGFSRGAELSLIVGSLSSLNGISIDALIAHSPSDVYNGPWNWNWVDPKCWRCKIGTGQCHPGSPKSDFIWNHKCGPDDPNKMDLSKSAWQLFNKNFLARTQIKIETYRGHILITVGNKDEVWPVEQTKRIENRLKSSSKTVEIHYFPNDGHVFKGKSELIRRQLVLDFLSRVN